MGKEGVEKIIDNIEELIDNCEYKKFSADRIIVVKEDLEELLHQLRSVLPGEIVRCKKIMRSKEAILADARKRSDAIVQESVADANRLVEDHVITERANVRANQIIDLANEQAQKIVDDAAEEANQLRLAAMYYTKDKLAEMKNIFNEIWEKEKENSKRITDSLEDDISVIETNIAEMDKDINVLSASSNMSYAPEETRVEDRQEARPSRAVEYDEYDDYDYDDDDEYYEDTDDYL